MSDSQDPSSQNPPPGNSNLPYAAPTPIERVEPKPQIERESLSLGGMLAWLTIAVTVVAMVSLTALFRSGEETRTEATNSDLFPIQMQARTVVGQKSLVPSTPTNNSNDADEGAKAKQTPAMPVPAELNAGTYEQRLCYVILVNENSGAEIAAEKIAELDQDAADAEFEFSKDQTRLRQIVGSLIERQNEGDFDSGFLPESDRKLLTEKLGWIGELALVPAGTPLVDTRKSLLADAGWSMGLMIAVVLLVVLLMLVGIVLAIVFAVMFGMGTLVPEFQTRGRSLNIYVETFAIWMVVFFGGPTLTALILETIGIEIGNGLNMAISLGFFVGSLVVLFYPVARGISFRQLREDIGWKSNSPLGDVGVSPFAYVAGMPLMAIGFIFVAVLTLISGLMAEPKPFGTSEAAGHPIQDIISSGQFLQIVYVVLMACVAAPIVEETMFRGVLYRHLRELSGSWARWISVVFAAVFNGVIFAAIHPQGFVAIPLLTALAISFSLAREWRDSLVAPILMHAINNGSLTVFMLVMMS